MNKYFKNIVLDQEIFQKFRRLYLFAFLAIALSIIISQLLIQSHINRQLNDSRIINIAGRQRMLSQKLTKEILQFKNLSSTSDRLEIANKIEKTFNLWSASHLALQRGSTALKLPEETNEEMNLMFSQANAYFIPMNEAANSLIKKIKSNPSLSLGEIENEIGVILKNEQGFLTKMNNIVFRYDEVSKIKVIKLKFLETLLLGISLLILLLEMVFLFRPISIKIRDTIKNLNETKQEALLKATELQEMYISKEESLLELQGLNYAIDNAALFVNVSQDGSVLHISKKFSKLLGLSIKDGNLPLEELLSIDESEQQVIQELRIRKRQSIWIGEVQVTSKSNQKLWLEMSIIPMNKVRSSQRVLILCNDITKRIDSQQEIDALNEQRFIKEVSQQKEQASQIVEAQEEERKRIAKDIHDGIGQMLTALKFNVESINTQNIESTSKKIIKLKELLRNLIKEVRTVTFNLTPPELADYGIVATLNKLANRLSGFTEKKVYFENKTEFNGRFDSLVETNLYRVVQEAVNNALKYAESNYILIALSHSEDILSITIDDDGKGFDVNKVGKLGKESGMGLFFMKERISYINGRIFINSDSENGTRVTINIAIPTG